MGNITLSIPDDVHARMREHPDIRWSEVARSAIVERLDLLKRMDELVKNSKLTQKDSIKLGRKINAAAAKRFLNDYNNRH